MGHKKVETATKHYVRAREKVKRKARNDAAEPRRFVVPADGTDETERYRELPHVSALLRFKAALSKGLGRP